MIYVLTRYGFGTEEGMMQGGWWVKEVLAEVIVFELGPERIC